MMCRSSEKLRFAVLFSFLSIIEHRTKLDERCHKTRANFNSALRGLLVTCTVEVERL